MEILVLGGTRFFGKRLVERLLAQGHAVTELLPLIDPTAPGLMTAAGPAEDTSPFFDTETTTLDTSRAQKAGFQFENLHDWLPLLIEEKRS